jgi:hypothetical protein
MSGGRSLVFFGLSLVLFGRSRGLVFFSSGSRRCA